MWEIDSKIVDYSHRDKESNICLNAQGNLYDFPLEWKGLLNGIKITIVQTDPDSSSIDSYDFIDLPDKYDHLKYSIKELIDNYLRILD